MVVAFRLLARRPSELAASKEVEMKMRNGFSPVGAVVNDDPETLFGVAFLTRDFSDLEQHVAKEGLVIKPGEGDSGDWLLGNEEKVNRSLGRDIAEAEAEVILEDDLGGDFAGDDFLKKSGFVAHGSRVR